MVYNRTKSEMLEEVQKPDQAANMSPRQAEEHQVDSWSRVMILKAAFIVFFLAIVARLGQIQIIESDKYKHLAQLQYEETISLPAQRGTIYDRNGTVVASHTKFISFWADARFLGSRIPQVAQAFSKAFGEPQEVFLNRLQKRTNGRLRRFVWLQRSVPISEASKIDIERFPGVKYEMEPKRLYPYEDLASSTLGSINLDGEGISGIEKEYDHLLSGSPGWVKVQRDGKGGQRPSTEYPRVDPTEGASLTLTLDLGLQSLLDQELKAGVEEYQAEGALGIIVRVRTGEIVAISSIEWNGSLAIAHKTRNRVITDMFEPGSIFKVVTAAAAYEHQIAKPLTLYDGENGQYKITMKGGRTRVLRDVHPVGTISFEDAIAQSSNIIMAKVAQNIGPWKFHQSARDFGFGVPTGIELPGESRGVLRKPFEWSGASLHSLSFGYEVSATALQVAMAYAAIANGGKLMKPYIISKIESSQGTLLFKGKPSLVRRVISEQTSSQLTQAMIKAVLEGTGTRAKSQSIMIAGKTGTSRRHGREGYEEGSYTASFAGFFPANAPEYSLVVMVDNPRDRYYYGGQVAAPIFLRVIERSMSTIPEISMNFAALKSESSSEGSTSVAAVGMPDVRGMSKDSAVQILNEIGLKHQIKGAGLYIVTQSPMPGTKLGSKMTISLQAGNLQNGHYVLVPDVRGMSVRKAFSLLRKASLDAIVSGSGVVIEQIPLPGTAVSPETEIQLFCRKNGDLTMR